MTWLKQAGYSAFMETDCINKLLHGLKCLMAPNNTVHIGEIILLLVICKNCFSEVD